MTTKPSDLAIKIYQNYPIRRLEMMFDDRIGQTACCLNGIISCSLLDLMKIADFDPGYASVLTLKANVEAAVSGWVWINNQDRKEYERYLELASEYDQVNHEDYLEYIELERKWARA